MNIADYVFVNCSLQCCTQIQTIYFHFSTFKQSEAFIIFSTGWKGCKILTLWIFDALGIPCEASLLNRKVTASTTISPITRGSFWLLFNATEKISQSFFARILVWHRCFFRNSSREFYPVCAFCIVWRFFTDCFLIFWKVKWSKSYQRLCWHLSEDTWLCSTLELNLKTVNLC